MSTPRSRAVEACHKRYYPNSKSPSVALQNVSSDKFGQHVFSRRVMQKMLPEPIYKNVIDAMERRAKIKPEYADSIAVAIKEWAVSLGATHYTHWFQPLTGASAEKHDAFIDWHSTDQMIEKFSGDQLLQGEPDASSFPSGGLRTTFEARGYTGWDPTSSVFVWKGGEGTTLCIPSVFFSWRGECLDHKIPLLRSDKRLNKVVLRLLRHTGIKANSVHTSLGLEQEYFVIDRSLRKLRPDLLLRGKTVYGAQPAKGQQLQDHYFGTVKDRILNFMHDFEQEALKLGIPVKTRHNEVAPAQHEVAPVFERAPLAVDHNILLMELMRKVAENHDLACLLHEKPFDGLNGSGKHSNWSIITDTGINLLNPSDTPETKVHFLTLLTAILVGIHRHSALLRASIASAGNDCRLGGHEAPPAILSVFLGSALEEVLDNIEKQGGHKSKAKKFTYDLGLLEIPELPKHDTDRNRTSPFAFTGNKFEFRAVGSSENPAFPVTVLNTIVAESLEEILEQVEAKMEKGRRSPKAFAMAVIPVLQKHLHASRPIRFAGDNYSQEWTEEAKRRKLPNLKRAIDSFPAIVESSTKKAFQGILTEEELGSRLEVVVENYFQTLDIEINLMIDLFRTQIYPAAVAYQYNLAKSIDAFSTVTGQGESLEKQTQVLERLAALIEQACREADALEKESQAGLKKKSGQEKAQALCKCMDGTGRKLRSTVDTLEQSIEDAKWPFPKYRELLFLV